MAQNAPLEPGTPLYEFALTVDPSTLPEKVRCKFCDQFNLNPFKTACCETVFCEKCNSKAQAAPGSPCPSCAHPGLSPETSKPHNPSRRTARNWLKDRLPKPEPKELSDATPSMPPTEPMQESVEIKPEPVAEETAETPPENLNGSQISQDQQATEVVQDLPKEQNGVVQSIEDPQAASKLPVDQPAVDEADVEVDDDDEDDDIQIHTGHDDEMDPIIPPEKEPVEEYSQQMRASQQPRNQPRKRSPKFDSRKDSATTYTRVTDSEVPPKAENAFNQVLDIHGQQAVRDDPATQNHQANKDMFANFQANWSSMQNMQGMPSMPNMSNMAAAMTNPQQMQQMMQWMTNMQNMYSMGAPSMNMNWPMGMSPMNMMNNMGMMNGFPMMNNGSSYDSNQQWNYPNSNQNLNRPGSFRGRGKNKRGRGNWNGHQNSFFNASNTMPFPDHYNQGYMQQQNQPRFDNAPMGLQSHQANTESEQITQDDSEFMPGGQEEIREALGDEYEQKPTTPLEEPKVDEGHSNGIKNDFQEEPSADVPSTAFAESPKAEVKEEYIPEAYREDLDSPLAPPSAPSGPSGRDSAFRPRGHGRFPSRGGRGSYQGSNGFAPRSPARPMSQHQTHSPPPNQGSGVVGAPTGPRAMRKKDIPVAQPVSRAGSDEGFKIRGTATQTKDYQSKAEPVEDPPPGETYEDGYSRDRDYSRRHSTKNDRKRLSDSDHDTREDDYGADGDRKHRKSRRETQDVDMKLDRSLNESHSTSHRSSRQDRDKPREKHTSSSSKRKSRHDADEEDDHNGADSYYEEQDSRSVRPSKGHRSKHEEREMRDERRERDYERIEKKHRKRSRVEREEDDRYDEVEEEESRRSRSHKSKKTEHYTSATSSRKDRDRERDDKGRSGRERERERDKENGTPVNAANNTVLGARIQGRSGESAQPEKDPQTLERERRNKERMLKEQQRREKAAQGLSGGRTRMYKYEDELPGSTAKPSRRR